MIHTTSVYQTVNGFTDWQCDVGTSTFINFKSYKTLWPELSLTLLVQSPHQSINQSIRKRLNSIATSRLNRDEEKHKNKNVESSSREVNRRQRFSFIEWHKDMISRRGMSWDADGTSTKTVLTWSPPATGSKYGDQRHWRPGHQCWQSDWWHQKTTGYVSHCCALFCNRSFFNT